MFYQIKYKQHFKPLTFGDLPVHSLFKTFEFARMNLKISDRKFMVVEPSEIKQILYGEQIMPVIVYSCLDEDSCIHPELIQTRKLKKGDLFIAPYYRYLKEVYQVTYVCKKYLRVNNFQCLKGARYELKGNFKYRNKEFVIPVEGSIKPCHTK